MHLPTLWWSIISLNHFQVQKAISKSSKTFLLVLANPKWWPLLDRVEVEKLPYSILLPVSGTITIGGVDITRLSDDDRSDFRANHLGFVFQDFLLLDHLTVAENIMLPIEMHGLEARFDLEEILERVGLASKKNSKINILSRGERQRVAIARAFIGKIPFLLADEPTGNLDTKNSQKIMDMLLNFAEELGVTVLLVTHDPEIYRRANRVIDLATFA